MTKSEKSRLSKWLPPVLWAAVIFTLSSIPQIKVSHFFVWDFALKKLAHISEYAILFTLVFRATNRKWIQSFTLTMLYAVSDEFHQSFIPGRSPTVIDLGLDLSGVNIASYIIWKLTQIQKKRPKR